MIVTTIDKLTQYKEIPYAQDIVDFLNDFKKSFTSSLAYSLASEC